MNMFVTLQPMFDYIAAEYVEVVCYHKSSRELQATVGATVFICMRFFKIPQVIYLDIVCQATI